MTETTKDIPSDKTPSVPKIPIFVGEINPYQMLKSTSTYGPTI